MLVLLGLSIFINFIDRGNLSIAAPLVKSELRLSATQLGLLLSAFFITYMPMQPVVGWLVDRFTASRVLVTGFLLWSLATVLSGLAGGYATLFTCRLLLGVGESVSFPAMSKILAENVSETQRGLANGIVLSGIALGPAFGIFFGGMLIAAYGWRPFFIAFGVLSSLWVVAWIAVARKHVHHSDAARASDAPATGLILEEGSLWGASVAQFCSNFVLYFLLTWIPYYLVHERHWSLQQMARIGGTAYLLMGVAMVASVWIADRAIAAGASPSVVRKAVFGVGAAGAAVCLMGCALSSDAGSAVWLVFAAMACGLLQANNWVVAQTLAGPSAAARWTGIQNTIANIAGIIAPSLTGMLVDRTGSFVLPFTIAAVLSLASGASWVFLVGPIAPIDWKRRAALTKPARAQLAD